MPKDSHTTKNIENKVNKKTNTLPKVKIVNIPSF